MDLPSLEARYGNFYAPAFKVKVGGKDLVRDLFLSVTQVEVDLEQSAAGHYSFTIANAFDWEAREFVAGAGNSRVDLLGLFSFGSLVDIAFGYAEASQTLLIGTVSEVRTSFSEGGIPELTVTGFDRLHKLTVGKASGKPLEQARDSDMVGALVQATGLRTDIRETEPKRPRIEQT